MGLYTLITIVLILAIIALATRLAGLKKTSREVSHQFDEAALIVESLRDGLIECDTQMIPTRINHAAEELLGLEASSIINRAIDKSSTSEADKLLAKILFAPKEATDSKDSYDVLTPSAKYKNVEEKLRIFTIPKTDPHTKQVVGYIKIIRDVTIENIVEMHKSDLVSIVSHQLLTPLTGVKWILKSMLGGDAGPLLPAQKDMLEKGVGANESMIELVTDILDVTKVEQSKFAYKMAKYDLVAFVKSCIDSRLEKAKTRKVRLDLTNSLTAQEATFDKERLGIALGNLLDNAIDYSPIGATVGVAITADSTSVKISISDHGIGIPPEEAARLFTKFYRAENAKRVRASGTGLGLYLAKHIVEDHGGKVSVTSKVNEGSTFTVLLPLGKALI